MASNGLPFLPGNTFRNVCLLNPTLQPPKMQQTSFQTHPGNKIAVIAEVTAGSSVPAAQPAPGSRRDENHRDRVISPQPAPTLARRIYSGLSGAGVAKPCCGRRGSWYSSVNKGSEFTTDRPATDCHRALEITATPHTPSPSRPPPPLPSPKDGWRMTAFVPAARRMLLGAFPSRFQTKRSSYHTQAQPSADQPRRPDYPPFPRLPDLLLSLVPRPAPPLALHVHSWSRQSSHCRRR